MEASFNPNKSIIPIWQPQGYSTYFITKKVAEKLGQKTTHTGVLDPMAEGVIIVLAGETRLEKNKYTNCVKTYEFDISFGIKTDSYDGMGLTTHPIEFPTFTSNEISNVLPKFVGKYSQTVPLYSARKVNGKKLFMYPKLGLDLPELPEKHGEIFSLELISIKTENTGELISNIISKIKNIKLGEFRQEEIISGWNKMLSELNSTATTQTATFKVEMTRGLYVRSLSQDICDKLGTIGMVSKLIRTKNGDYEKKDCCTLEEVC